MAEPTPSERPEDWGEVGQQMFEAVLTAFLESGAEKWFIANAGQLIGDILAVAFTLTAPIGIGFAKGMADAEDLVAPAFSEAAAVAVNDIFGTNIASNTFDRARGGAARKPASDALANGLLDQMRGTRGALEPSEEPAKKYLGAMTQIALEDWFKGWFFEVLSSLVPQFDIGKIESYGALGDKVAEVLGLGRISRRVLAPLVDAAIVTPMQWSTNKSYRPNLLSTALAVRQFHRGKWTREQLDEELARQGWSPDRIDALVFDASQKFSDAQIKALRAGNVIDDSEAIAKLRLNGWSDEDAAANVAAWRVDRVYAYADRELSALASAFIDRDLSPSAFSAAVGFLLPEATLASSFKSYAEHARAYNVKHLSHAEMKECVTRGILNRSDYRRWLDREGYPPDEAAALELLLVTEVSDQRELEKKRAETDAERAADKQKAADEKARKQAEIEARNARTFPSLSDIERAVVRGLLDVSAYEQRLIDLKYAESDRAFLVALVDQQREDYLDAQQRKHDAEAAQPEKAIGLADLERAVITGRASLDDYRRRLESDSYPAADVALMVTLLGDRVQDARTAAEKRRAAAAELGKRGLSLSQVEKAVRQRLATLDQYRGFLLAQGFTQEDAALLTASLQQDIADADAAAAKRDVVNSDAQARGVSLATLERAVKLGVRTRDDYAQKLIDLGVPVDDQVTLLGLLDAELANANAARAKREQPPPAPEPPGLSRADLESAVRAGLASIDTYRAFLLDAGYADADADTLANLLLLELQDAAAARTRRDQLDSQNPARALARSDVERAVKAGIRTIDDYRAQLDLLGYAPDDRELLVALLQKELDAKKTAQQRRAALLEVLAAAGVDLDAMDAAVLEGTATMDDYVGTLVAAGVKPVDVALLVQLLLEKQASGNTPGGG